MIKKVFTILLTLNFLVLSVGIAQSLHLCQNRLQEVTFFASFEDADACCTAPDMPKGCCTSESSYVHLDGDFNYSDYSIKIPILSEFGYLEAYIIAFNSLFKETAHVYPPYTAFPKDKQPLYIINQAFLI